MPDTLDKHKNQPINERAQALAHDLRDFELKERAELGNLHPLAEKLAHYDVAAPDSTRLLAALEGIAPAPQNSISYIEESGLEAEAKVEIKSPYGAISHWLRLAQAQTSLLETPFWWASGLLILVGALIGANTNGGITAALFALFAPLLAAGGVAYMFRPATRGLWELERISPVSPVELLYARLALILAINAAFALVLLPFVWNQMALWRVLLIWFGPMIGLAGIALYISVRWSTLAGMIIPMGLWTGLLVFGWRDLVERITQVVVYSDPIVYFAGQIAQSNTLMVWSGAALVTGVTLFWLAGRWVTRNDEAW